MTQRVSHHIEIDAAPDRVFELLLDAGRWPVILSPTLHVEYLERTPTSERLRIWARANDSVRRWESCRRIDAGARVIEFEQVAPAPPAALMAGRWSVEAGETLATRLVLDHRYAAIDDDPDDLAWIERATERNSTSELANLKALAERGDASDDVDFTFADTVSVNGRAEDVYRFIFEADAWSERLGHVAAARVSDEGHDVQGLEMDTVAPDGSKHTTHSYRVCRPHGYVAYKQTAMPPLLHAHIGRWSFIEDGDHVTITSEHTVTLNPEAVGVLGPETTVADARAYVQGALSANSLKTLTAAKAWAESLPALKTPFESAQP
jgi:aromatase